MKNQKRFKPILAPNEEVDLDKIKYPISASFKLDGIRCIFYKGKILSRSLKPIQNKQLKEKLEPIRSYSEIRNIILDGEIYSPKLTFQEITSFVMTQDFEDKKSIKKFGKILKIPEHLKFYCFDSIRDDLFDQIFFERMLNANLNGTLDNEIYQYVEQFRCDNKDAIIKTFNHAIEHGFEGLILRDPKGYYKCGRGTLKEGIIYKVKPYRTFDAEIVDVVQATKVDPNAEKKINELGRSVTSKKKGDRILIEKASAFWVEYDNKPLKVCIACTDKEKEEIWKNRSKYIGRMIEYKGMIIGSKDVPRHPVLVRFREDKDT